MWSFCGLRPLTAACRSKRKRPDQPVCQSGRRDLNPPPQRPERCALTKLRYFPVLVMLPDRTWTAPAAIPPYPPSGGNRLVGLVLVGPAAQQRRDRLPQADRV